MYKAVYRGEALAREGHLRKWLSLTGRDVRASASERLSDAPATDPPSAPASSAPSKNHRLIDCDYAVSDKQPPERSSNLRPECIFAPRADRQVTHRETIDNSNIKAPKITSQFLSSPFPFPQTPFPSLIFERSFCELLYVFFW